MVVALRAQEPPPCRIGRAQRRRRYPPELEDPTDRGCADPMPELEQLALDALISPAQVLAGHSFDQCGDSQVEGRAAGSVRVGPLLDHQAAMPPQDCGRGDQTVSAQARGEASDQRGEHGSVSPIQAWLAVGSAQYRDLVAQHEQLDVLGRGCASEQHQPAEKPTEDQIEQT
jgi:hypothetical protein